MRRIMITTVIFYVFILSCATINKEKEEESKINLMLIKKELAKFIKNIKTHPKIKKWNIEIKERYLDRKIRKRARSNKNQ